MSSTVGPTSEEVFEALVESVRLQSHYATLLNQFDGGHRSTFSDAHAWIQRLRTMKSASRVSKTPEHGDIRITHSIETSVDVEMHDDTLTVWRWIGQLKLRDSDSEVYYFVSSDETVRHTYSSLVAAIDDLQSRGHRRML